MGKFLLHVSACLCQVEPYLHCWETSRVVNTFRSSNGRPCGGGVSDAQFSLTTDSGVAEPAEAKHGKITFSIQYGLGPRYRS